MLAVEATHPQPPWAGAATFAASYHAVQALPYLGGVVLVAGLLVWTTSVAVTADARHRVRAALSMLAAAVFAALIVLNYALQSSYVPALAQDFDAADAPLLSALTMANPTSLAWAIEMWGWGAFGVCTWLLGPVFATDPLGRVVARLCAVNGALSVIGTAATVARPGWVLEPSGLAAFALWNALLLALVVLASVWLRRRARQAVG